MINAIYFFNDEQKYFYYFLFNKNKCIDAGVIILILF